MGFWTDVTDVLFAHPRTLCIGDIFWYVRSYIDSNFGFWLIFVQEVKTAEMATLHPGPVVPPQAHIPSHHSASTVTEPSEEHKLLSYPSPNQSNSEYSRAKQRSPNPPNLANDASGANLGTHDEQIQFTPQDEWLRRPTRIDTEMRIGTELPQGDSGTASILTGVEEHPFQPARRHIASSTG